VPPTERFQLFVPSEYPARLLVSGRSGIQPDVRFGGARLLWAGFYRSRLPDLSQTAFTFSDAFPVIVANFYHLEDLFIAAGAAVELLEHRLGDTLERAAVDVRHADGSPAALPYFAIRVNQVIDCIDPERSTWKRSTPASSPVLPFSQGGLSRCLLDARCAPEFANDGADGYASYPSVWFTHRVHLDHSRIPPDTVLFQPKFWPGKWLIDRAFARELEQACRGCAAGYYFWALNLENVSKAHEDLRHALR
jgi:hypothetical protein